MDKASPEYRLGLERARVPLRPFESWTWAEVVLFRNPPKPRCPEYRLKITYTCEADFARLRTADLRRALSDDRYVDLSPLPKFKRNCGRKKGGHAADAAHEEPVLAEMRKMEAGNAEANGGADAPPSLMGFVGRRFAGAGFIRHAGQFGLLVWAAGVGGDGPLPIVVLSQLNGGEGADPFLTLPLAPAAEGAGRRWFACVHSGAYRAHLTALKARADARKAADRTA